jgi:hypothetical protein
MHGRYEDNRGPLEARVLSDHGGQLETVELGHAYVHQHYGYFGLEKQLKRFLRRVGFYQVLPETVEHNLIAEQLAWLVINHEDIDSFIFAHSISAFDQDLCYELQLPVKPHAQR